MKTPMQELILQLEEEYREYTSHKGNDDWYTSVAYGIETSIRHAKSMLEKEKEVIMDAYMEGGDWESLPQPRFDNYYNQTFNTKEK